ncbi:hypothetical protein [Geodermatophilus sp. SYSU D00710]
MRSPRLGAVALLGTAVLAAGCSSAVAGAARVEPTAAGPFTEEVGRVDVDAATDDLLQVLDLAASPDGGFVALLTSEDPTLPASAFLELVPGDGGLTAGAVTEGPPLVSDGEVWVAPDGTAIAMAPVLLHPGDPGWAADPYGSDLVLTVLEPGADEPRVVPVAADPELGTPDLGTAVLSPDGTTLSAVLQWRVDGVFASRLATVDVATGDVLASAPLRVDAGGWATEVAAAPHQDGGLAALVTVRNHEDGDADDVVLARYDTDLQPVGEPVVLVGEEVGTGHALAVLADGTVLASVYAGGYETGQALLLTVRDGVVGTSTVLPGPAPDLAVEPGEGHVHLSHGRPGSPVGVATVDLATGQVVADVPVCADGTPAPVALAADGRTLASGAGCWDEDDHLDPAVLVG